MDTWCSFGTAYLVFCLKLFAVSVLKYTYTLKKFETKPNFFKDKMNS